MDNENNQTQEQEEVTGIKISEFPAASALSESDTVTGLQAGNNVRFTLSAILSWIVQKINNAFVSASRTINGKSLASDITLNASDVGARPDNWTPSAADVGAIPATAAGEPLGVAELDSSGKVPSTQLPPIASTASDVTYDNTGSGLSASDVQEALDELAAGAGGSTAASTSYDNTGSGLAATNAQDAIDELSDEKADQITVAPVETSTTASRAYAAGEYFCWNGLLYRAKTAISSGATFTPGTNCESKTVGTYLIHEKAFTGTTGTYGEIGQALEAGHNLLGVRLTKVGTNVPINIAVTIYAYAGEMRGFYISQVVQGTRLSNTAVEAVLYYI